MYPAVRAFTFALRHARIAVCLGLLSLPLVAKSVSAAPAPDAPLGGVLAADDPASPPTTDPAAPPPTTTPAAPPPTTSPAASPPASTAAKLPPSKWWSPRTETGTIHFHGGLFAPNNSASTGTTFGARLGFNAGSHVLLGVLGDWSFSRKSLLEPVPSDLPGLHPNRVLATVDASLIPAMAFLQVKLTDRFPIVPYAGIAGGYEWLILKATDYRTDATASAIYADLAWQGYTGLGLRLSNGLRLDGELFYNGGSLTRDLIDSTGLPFKESVNVNGVGARVGIDIAY